MRLYLVRHGRPAATFGEAAEAVGAALGDERVITFAPDHCSITVLDVEGGRWRLVERGAEAATVPG